MTTIKLAERLKTEPDARAKIVDFLEEHLEDARNGLVATVLIISKDRQGRWKWNHAGDSFATDMIGRMEIVKHELTAGYIAAAKKE